MTKLKNILSIVLLILFTSLFSYSQNNVKKDLYLYFESNSNNIKLTRAQKPTTIKNQYFPDEYDIYGIKSIIDDGKRESLTLLFSTINKYRYAVTDSVELKMKKIFPFKGVLSLKGIRFDTSDLKHFPYARVFIIEHIGKNQFKIVQVQSYFGSDVLLSKPIE